MNKLFYLLFVVICWGCIHDSETEKYQSTRDNVVDVQSKMKKIVIENVLVGQNAHLNIVDNYLIISDSKSYDKVIHLFDKTHFNYLTSIGYRGEGPDEITNMGYVGVDEIHHKFYVNDHGKQKILSYDIDSVLSDTAYKPTVKMRMNETQFPDRYEYINDTLCIGLIIHPIGYSDFKPVVSKWNMITGEIKPMKYNHPEIEKKRICFAVSMKHGIYVECYHYHDLMTICNLDGSLKYNIYGSYWDNRKSNETLYYNQVLFCGDKIIASYAGKPTFSKNVNGGIKSNQPTNFIIFDVKGNYLKTLDTGYGITEFRYDKDNNRLVMSLDDGDLQFAYLELDGII